jgi:hypothetical protein
MGLGFSGVSQIQARLVDPLYRRLKEKNGGKAEPEFRLPFMIPASINIPAGLIIYGWSAQVFEPRQIISLGLIGQ